jgi:hypothetical protein
MLLAGHHAPGYVRLTRDASAGSHRTGVLALVLATVGRWVGTQGGQEGLEMAFRSEAEFKQVFEQIFQLMNEHPVVGRTLRDARAPHRFDISDFGLEFNVTYADPGEEANGRYLRWCWGPGDWEPLITLKMASEVANRYFQGKENIAIAVAMGRVKLRGPLSRILELAPVTKPIHPVYREWLKTQGLDHLLA